MSLRILLTAVADVDRAVGVRGAVVQHEARPAARELAQLADRCRCSHSASCAGSRCARSAFMGKLGLRQVDRVLVVGHAVKSINARMPRACSASRSICAVKRAREAKRCFVAQLRRELHFDLAPVEVAREIEHVRLQQRARAVTVGRVPRLATAGSAAPLRSRARAPRRRPSTGARRRSSARLAVGNPRSRPSRSPAITRARIDQGLPRQCARVGEVPAARAPRARGCCSRARRRVAPARRRRPRTRGAVPRPRGPPRWPLLR